MKKSIIGILALLASASLCAFADGTAAVATTISPQAKGVVEEMRGLDMRLGNPFMDDLRPNLKEQHKLAIINELRSIGPDAIPALIQALNDPDVGPRNSACIALGDIGPLAKEALPALQKALNDPEPDVRQFARGAIEKIEKPVN
jgi:HEAT repeat protein